MENKELHSKIEKSLNSLDHIRQAEANPFLLTRVMEKMKVPMPIILKPMVIWQVAVSMILIAAFNMAIGFYVLSRQSPVIQTTESTYFNNNLYSY